MDMTTPIQSLKKQITPSEEPHIFQNTPPLEDTSFTHAKAALAAQPPTPLIPPSIHTQQNNGGIDTPYLQQLISQSPPNNILDVNSTLLKDVITLLFLSTLCYSTPFQDIVIKSLPFLGDKEYGKHVNMMGCIFISIIVSVLYGSYKYFN